MARRQYLICYDIVDDRRRTRVFKTLMGQGDHVQYSVFLCALNPQEHVRLRGELQGLIHNRDDQIILVDLGNEQEAEQQVFDSLGKHYEPLIRVRVI